MAPSAFAVLLLTFFLSVCKSNYTNFDGNQLFRIIPSLKGDVPILSKAFQILQMDVWHEARNSSPYFDVMVDSQQSRSLKLVLDLLDIKANISVSLLEQRSENIREPSRNQFDWFDYHTLDDMYSWMRSKVEQKASIASLLLIGESSEGRPLLGLRIAHKRNLPIVVIEAGVHAREWIGPPTALWFANEALAGQPLDTRLQIASAFEWHIFPNLNPDGYVYSYTRNRWWRKNRSTKFSSCVGVDLNRNFPFKWERKQRGETCLLLGGVPCSPLVPDDRNHISDMVGMSNSSKSTAISPSPGGESCSETYSGPGPGSESETRALANHLSSIASRTKVFISLHSYGQYLMYPWAHTRNYAFGERRLREAAQQAAASLARRYGTSYSVGRVASTLYRVGGSSLDYAYSLNIPSTFVFELRGGEMSATSPGGFLLPRSQIIPTAQETYDAVLVILQRALEQT